MLCVYVGLSLSADKERKRGCVAGGDVGRRMNCGGFSCLGWVIG